MPEIYIFLKSHPPQFSNLQKTKPQVKFCNSCLEIEGIYLFMFQTMVVTVWLQFG